MNVPQYGGGGQQQPFHHQEVPPVQQQYAANNAGENVGVSNALYCSNTNSQTSQFNNTQINGKSQTLDTTTNQNCAPSYPSESQQQSSGIRQSNIKQLNGKSQTIDTTTNQNCASSYPSESQQQSNNIRQSGIRQLNGKSQTIDTTTNQNCTPSYPSESQQSNSIRQSFNTSSNAPQKVDASTMTEKETQVTNDGFFGTGQQQDCKSSYPITAMIPSPATWQSLAGPPGSTVAEYLSRLPASTLPLTLHHFLKFSAATNEGPPQTPTSGLGIKKDDEVILTNKKKKRKYKKKPYIPRPPRPRPGEIRLTTALDGSTLYCCPECHMAYPERELLEQHLVVHRLERRFVCDICGAGLKRKEHLDRHKQGHNPERPYTCSVCLKAFKRNEHLSRHFVIHSGDKTQVCTECGKSFYRKDHLRKHAQSHIAKRLRAELIGQKSSPSGGNGSQGLGALNNMATSSGITAVALMPGGATLPILSS